MILPYVSKDALELNPTAPTAIRPEFASTAAAHAPTPAHATKLKRIRVISEGRPGHENQSVGLAEALARRTGAIVETMQIPARGWLWQRCAAAIRATEGCPQLIIGAGHKVHLPMLYAARKYRAKTAVVMKPTWPHWLFDLCIIPQHDAPPLFCGGQIVRVFGALNRLPESAPAKQPRGLILVGGPSKAHGWNGENNAANIQAVIQARPDLKWTISDSRRTPADFLNELRRRKINAEIFSNEMTPRQWVPEQLMTSEEAWVTEDSVSMIFEAVTAGARTGILPAPVRKPSADPVRAIRELSRAGFATDFETWRQNGGRLPAPKPLHETGRCADLILAELFAS